MALKSAILVLYLQPGPAAHLAAHAPTHSDELPPGSEGVNPPPVHASWWRAPPSTTAAPPGLSTVQRAPDASIRLHS